MHKAPTILALGLLLSGCPASPPDATPPPQPTSTAEPEPTGAPPPTPATDRPATADELRQLVASNTAFAVDLYRQLELGDDNAVLSPASISLALAMAYRGAGGETAAEMKRTLHFTEDEPAVHRAFEVLLRRWQPDGRPYDLFVANRLFGDKSFSFAPEFQQALHDHYLAPLEPVDFRGAPDPARMRINAWVEEQTKNKIEQLLPERSVSPDTRMVLVNAVYFKGTWQHEFDVKQTKPGPFYAPQGKLEVPTMHLDKRLSYAAVDGLKIVDLAYRGGAMAMSILLPDKRDGLAALEAKLSREGLERWLAALRPAQVRLALPRFRIEPSAPLALSDHLKALGMKQAFDPKSADFTRMVAGRPTSELYLSDAFHKAFVEVNEKGTEAAAATGVVVGVTSLPLPSEVHEMIVDHPFLFFIRDVGTGSLLFMGRVTQPQ